MAMHCDQLVIAFDSTAIPEAMELMCLKGS